MRDRVGRQVRSASMVVGSWGKEVCCPLNTVLVAMKVTVLDVEHIHDARPLVETTMLSTRKKNARERVSAVATDAIGELTRKTGFHCDKHRRRPVGSVGGRLSHTAIRRRDLHCRRAHIPAP